MKTPATTIYDVVSRCVVIDLGGKTILLGPFNDRKQAMRAADSYIQRRTQPDGDPEPPAD